MHTDGQCHCGQTTCKAEIDPGNVGICHHADCQALTGSPDRVTVVADVGTIRCSGAAANVWGIRWGSINLRAELKPLRQIWRRSAMPWAQDISALSGKETAQAAV